MHSMLGNIYVCERTFSTMKQVKSKNKNRMADEMLDNSLQLAQPTLVYIDNEMIVSKKPQPQAYL